MILSKDINGNISYVSVSDGKLPYGYTALTQDEIDAYNSQRYISIRQSLCKRIASMADTEADKLVYMYPQIERDSWPTIRDEAQKIIDGVILPAEAQFVLDDAIRATGNQVPTDAEIVLAAQAVLANSAAYRSALNTIKTNVRVLQAQISALSDAELENYQLVWPV